MLSQKSKVLLVGVGDWSAKVSRVIEEQNPNLQIQIMSAREFLSQTQSAIEDFVKSQKIELIWITTNPGLQIEVLGKLKSLKCKVILEKPIARNCKELIEIEDAISSSKSEVYLSQPWTYSDIWTHFLDLLGQKGEVDRVVMSRGDNKSRTDISPGVDWIPHDLYLIASIAQKFSIHASEVELISVNQTLERISATVNIGERYSVEIAAGHFPSRIAEVAAYSNLGLMIKLDFLTGEIESRETNGDTLLMLPTGNSLDKMLNHYLTNSMKSDWKIILKLYSSVLQ
jgi:predicted dehydrogenase